MEFKKLLSNYLSKEEIAKVNVKEMNKLHSGKIKQFLKENLESLAFVTVDEIIHDKSALFNMTLYDQKNKQFVVITCKTNPNQDLVEDQQ